MNGDDAKTGDDNAKESDQRQQGLRRRVEGIWVERDSTRVNATTATTRTTPASGLFTMVTIFCPIHSYRQSCGFRLRFIF